MLGRTMEPPANSDQWVLRNGKDDYPAGTLETLRAWFAGARIPPDSQIYDPEAKAWIRPEALIPRIVGGVVATTGPGVDGRQVAEYIDIESVEIVIGTGIFSEFGGDIADFFGQRSTGFEQKLQVAKKMALQRLKLVALQRGGDAVIAVDLDYAEFSGNRIAVIANGTIVKLRA